MEPFRPILFSAYFEIETTFGSLVQAKQAKTTERTTLQPYCYKGSSVFWFIGLSLF
jgi:hypothetical protein